MEVPSHISLLLKELREEFSHILCIEKYENDELVLRSDANKPKEACTFVDIYAKTTKTAWIVFSNLTSPEKMIFRKCWVCKHKSRINSEQKPSKCKAYVKIKIKKVNKSTIKNDKLLGNKPPLCMIIRIGLQHNHDIKSLDYLKKLPVSEDIKTRFYKYFEEGMSAIEAKRFHEKTFILSKDFDSLDASSINPTIRQVNHLYANWKTKWHFESSRKWKSKSKSNKAKNKSPDFSENNKTKVMTVVRGEKNYSLPLTEEEYTSIVEDPSNITEYLNTLSEADKDSNDVQMEIEKETSTENGVWGHLQLLYLLYSCSKIKLEFDKRNCLKMTTCKKLASIINEKFPEMLVSSDDIVHKWKSLIVYHKIVTKRLNNGGQCQWDLYALVDALIKGFHSTSHSTSNDKFSGISSQNEDETSQSESISTPLSIMSDWGSDNESDNSSNIDPASNVETILIETCEHAKEPEWFKKYAEETIAELEKVENNLKKREKDLNELSSLVSFLLKKKD